VFLVPLRGCVLELLQAQLVGEAVHERGVREVVALRDPLAEHRHHQVARPAALVEPLQVLEAALQPADGVLEGLALQRATGGGERERRTVGEAVEQERRELGVVLEVALVLLVAHLIEGGCAM